MIDPTKDKREAKREPVFSPVQYQYSGMTEPEKGVLANISSTGLMLWTTRDFCPEGKLTIWLESTHTRYPAIAVNALVVRTELTHDSQYAFGYGCQIVDELDHAPVHELSS